MPEAKVNDKRTPLEQFLQGESVTAYEFMGSHFLEMFADSFSLTEREKEVLEVLLVSDENVQDIAETLMISRAALYRHIASLNEKTGTKSRIGLVQFYYRYHRRNEG